MCSRLCGREIGTSNLPDTHYSSDLLDVILRALNAACGDQRLPDDNGGRALRTAMASQIKTAVGEGERDPERLTPECYRRYLRRLSRRFFPTNTLLHA